MRRETTVRSTALGDRHHARERTALEEAPVEDLTHVAHLVQLAHLLPRAQRLVVGVERADATRHLSALERTKRSLGCETARLDRVVNSLQPRYVDESRALPDQQEPRRVEAARERVVAALRDRLRAPRDPLAPAEDLPD